MDFDFDPRKLLRRRSSLVVADLPTREHLTQALKSSRIEESESEEGSDEEDAKQKTADGKMDNGGKEEKKKPPPTQFKEPDANSLLDAFGF